ncbi:TPA: gp53-like domain-containing protein [Salmonella enterica subsp. enterica]
MNSFVSGENYMYLPNGKIIQFFSAESDSSGRMVNFPIPFPNKCLAVSSIVLISNNQSPTQQYLSITTPSLTVFFAKYNYGTQNTFQCIAIGE